MLPTHSGLCAFPGLTLPVRIVTPWTPLPGFDPTEAYEIPADVAATCDALFQQLVCEVVHRAMPWLPEALSAAGAIVGASPGKFEFVLPNGEFHEVPELACYLKLVPWRESHEPCH